MPIYEENYNNTQLTLISGGETQVTNFVFNVNAVNYAGDYVKMSVFTEDDTFVASYKSNVMLDDNITPELRVYNSSGNFFVKPNEVLERDGVGGGKYKLKFDFMRNLLSPRPHEEEIEW